MVFIDGDAPTTAPARSRARFAANAGHRAVGSGMKWTPQTLDPKWPFDLFRSDFALDAESTALIVIDMQVDQLAVKPDSPLAGRYPQVADYWLRRANETVVPNIQRLIKLFRARGLRIVFTRNGNVTSTGDEMTARLKAKLAGAPPAARPLPRRA